MEFRAPTARRNRPTNPLAVQASERWPDRIGRGERADRIDTPGNQ
ncbi:hypothetical protein [Haladaptatus pallidirubidus]|nr:hypothetical protein [Haladaptatus pallidirubidus]